ncbi:MAG: class I SAM-dependent methyltransferase [Desulfobacterales bacterium]|nr:class I SAM-dependent methyltransferase [Desulfobacterales bacterium]
MKNPLYLYKLPFMGHIFTFNDVKVYKTWADFPVNQAALQRETRLMMGLLKPLPGRRLLDIGCGAGGSLLGLRDSGLSLTGIDPSPYMLDAAKAVLGNRVDLHRGVAEDLPFEDNAFHYVLIVKSLEFVDYPKMAIAEACRVAKDRVFIGIMSRHAIKKTQRQLKKAHEESFMDKANPVSLRELKETVHEILGKVPVAWRSLCNIPIGSENIARCLEESFWLHHCPFGNFTGMVITPTPRFRTRPLSVPCTANQGPESAII